MTVINQYHRIVCRWLSELGVPYADEYPVGRWSLDIYLPDMRRGVEVDGPAHNKRKDAERDVAIQQEHGIEVVRIKVGTRKEEALAIMFEDKEE